MMNLMRNLFLPFCLIGLFAGDSLAQGLAAGKGKFLGSSMSDVRSDFTRYWNQVTPENAGKWGSVEGTQGSFNWTPLDVIYNFALANSFPYKHHNLVWGSQQPSWITSLDSAAQRAAVEQWIDTVAQLYGSSSFVDVVNEPFHSPPPYINALGGTGKTGYDWVITAFQLARKYFFPGVKLLVNDYNILQDNTVTTNYIKLIDTLLARHLIDGIGIQGHYFEFRSPAGAASPYVYSISTIKSNLDRLTAIGFPVYISEFDIDEAADSTQLQSYQTYFPLFWEDPGVKGMTLWGYVQGLTWKPNTYLIRYNGTERPALQWLRKYLAIPWSPALVSPVGTSVVPRNPELVWNSSATARSYRVQVASGGSFASPVVDVTTADTMVQVGTLAANTAYAWHVSAINDSGASSFSAPANFTTNDQIINSVSEPEGLPGRFALLQNYPNPFNPATVIRFQIPASGDVLLSVYDLLGREVARLVDGKRAAGSYEVTFSGERLPSGVYFYRLRSGAGETVRSMVLLK